MKLTTSVEDTKTLQSQIVEKEKKLQHVEDQLKKAEAIVLHHKQALDHAEEEQKKEGFKFKKVIESNQLFSFNILN